MDFGMHLNVNFYMKQQLLVYLVLFKNFIVCHGVNISKGFIVMPIAENKSLDCMLSEEILSNWNWNEKLSIVTQIVCAMRTLHRYGIMHRDLKPANILLDVDFNCYLADFGIARSPVSQNGNRKRSMTMNVGTNIYMAPEVLQGDGSYSEQIDVFSFGVILWQIACNCAFPYVDQGIPFTSIPTFVTSGSRLEIPDDIPVEIANLISSCWAQNPKKRPTFSQIYRTLADIKL